MRHSKKLAALAIAAGVAITATAAFAYWTAGGSGSDTATAASSNGTVEIALVVPDGIFPGGSVDVPVSATTSAGTDLYISSFNTPVITVSNAYDALTNADGCKASDFDLDISGLGGGVVEHGVTPTSLGTAVLSMENDTANSQDGCKGVTVSVALSSR